MPASTKKVTKPTAKAVALDKGIAKNVAKNVAKRAAKAAKAPAATTKPVETAKAPTAGEKPATLAKAVAANSGKPSAAETKDGPLVTGAKATILSMIEMTKGGVSAGEIAKKLGWPKAGGTIARAIKLASFKVAKVRDAEGVLRYSREG